MVSVWVRFEVDLRSEMVLGSFWNGSGVGLGWIGIGLGSIWNRFGIGLGSMRIGLGSLRHQFGSVWDRFGIGQGSVGDRFGYDMGHYFDTIPNSLLN